MTLFETLAQQAEDLTASASDLRKFTREMVRDDIGKTTEFLPTLSALVALILQVDSKIEGAANRSFTKVVRPNDEEDADETLPIAIEDFTPDELVKSIANGSVTYNRDLVNRTLSAALEVKRAISDDIGYYEATAKEWRNALMLDEDIRILFATFVFRYSEYLNITSSSRVVRENQTYLMLLERKGALNAIVQEQNRVAQLLDEYQNNTSSFLLTN